MRASEPAGQRVQFHRLLASETSLTDALPLLRGTRFRATDATVAIPSPLTRKDLRRITGMSHCERVAGIGAAGEDWWRLMIDEEQRRKANVEKTVVHQLHRMVQQTRA